MSNPTTESSAASPVKVEAPSEHPKVSLVNASLKNLKFHLAKFDSVVKIRTTHDALTEGRVCGGESGSEDSSNRWSFDRLLQHDALITIIALAMATTCYSGERDERLASRYCSLEGGTNCPSIKGTKPTPPLMIVCKMHEKR
ncbi:hypothetical protein Tco_0436174 [Tanacetum coccineum]